MWLDLVGEREQARGRMIDDDKKAAVMLKRSPKELRDHFCAREPTVGKCRKQVPSDAIQHWCRSRRVFFLPRPPMEIAAASTTAGDSDANVSALHWYGSWHEKGHGQGKNREKGNGTGKGKCTEKKGKEKG